MKLQPKSELNVLISYGTRAGDYSKMIFDNRHLINSFALDSGTFSLNNPNQQGKSINLEGYKAFCTPSVRKQFNLIFNYDEVFTKDGFNINLENMRELEDAGIDVVPVVHDYSGEIFKEIEFYLEMNYPVIALGSSSDKNKKSIVQDAVLRITNGGAKVHRLGISSFQRLLETPVHYCDSSSWSQYVMFGDVCFWNQKKSGNNKTDIIYIDDTIDISGSKKPKGVDLEKYDYKESFLDYIQNDLGLDRADLFGHELHLNRSLVNIHYFIRIQTELRKLYKSRRMQVNKSTHK